MAESSNSKDVASSHLLLHWGLQEESYHSHSPVLLLCHRSSEHRWVLLVHAVRRQWVCECTFAYLSTFVRCVSPQVAVTDVTAHQRHSGQLRLSTLQWQVRWLGAAKTSVLIQLAPFPTSNDTW